MGWRWRRSVKIAPGVRLNLGKRGSSVSIGGRGSTMNIGKKGVRTTVGIPGTGLSYSTRRAKAGCLGCLIPMGGLAMAFVSAIGWGLL